MRAFPAARRRAFTLLEVILALAILGIALATLGQAVRMSHQNAQRAATESDATLVAESVLAELLAGIRPFTEIEREAWSPEPTGELPRVEEQWLVSITIDSGPLDELVALRVRVEPAAESLLGAAPVELVRWTIDPSLTAEEEAL